MANRYWVGGTASWDATAGSKWATSSGGSGGASVPTSADNVFFDAASGAVTVTVNASSSCLDLTFTGFTGTFTGSQDLNVAGSLTLATGMTSSYTGIMTFSSTATGRTITCNGKNPANNLFFDGIGGGWVLQDAVTISNNFRATNGTVNTNGKMLLADHFQCKGAA